MNILLLLLSLYMVCIASTLPIISKPLENNPDHLTWEEPIFMAADTLRSDDKTRKIPKSIFITPNLNDSKENCPPDHKLGPDGKCYKTLKIDPLVILKTQIDALFKRNKTATTEYDDYDYSEYAESTESMSNTHGKYPIPMISLGFASESYQPQQTQSIFPLLNRVTKDNSHAVSTTTVSFVLDRTTRNGVTGIPFLQSTTGTHLGSENHIGESKYAYSIDAGTTSNLLASTANSTMTPMIVPSTEAITTSNCTQPFLSKDEYTTPSNQYIPDTESIDLTTMNEDKNTTELDNTESETKVEDKFEENENEFKSIETNIEYETSTLNESGEFTTEITTEPLSQDIVSESNLKENSTDLLEISLSPVSQMSREIEDILHDFNDKNPHFLQITNETAKTIEKLLINPYAELSSLNDTLALSSQMVTEQYEWIDNNTLFKPSEADQNDSSEIFSEENDQQSKIQSGLEKTHLISDEELLSRENTTTSESEIDQLMSIKRIRENQSQLTLTTDGSTNRKHDDIDTDNLDLRLAEESFFQPINSMKNDIQPNKEFNLNQPSHIHEIALNNTNFIAEHSISDYVTEEPQNYDTIEGNTQTEYSIEPKLNTERSMSIYSTFINRLKTPSSSDDQNKDRLEQSTQQTVKQFETNTNDGPTIEPTHTLIIKKPPKQGKSMLSTVT